MTAAKVLLTFISNLTLANLWDDHRGQISAPSIRAFVHVPGYPDNMMLLGYGETCGFTVGMAIIVI